MRGAVLLGEQLPCNTIRTAVVDASAIRAVAEEAVRMDAWQQIGQEVLAEVVGGVIAMSIGAYARRIASALRSRRRPQSDQGDRGPDEIIR